MRGGCVLPDGLSHREVTVKVMSEYQCFSFTAWNTSVGTPTSGRKRNGSGNKLISFVGMRCKVSVLTNQKGSKEKREMKQRVKKKGI